MSARSGARRAPQVVTRPLITLSIVFTLGVLFGPAESPKEMIALLVALSLLSTLLGAGRRIISSFIVPVPFFILGLLVANYRLPERETLSAQPGRIGPPGALLEGTVAEMLPPAIGVERLLIDVVATSTAVGGPLKPGVARVRVDLFPDPGVTVRPAPCGEPGDRVRILAQLAPLREPASGTLGGMFPSPVPRPRPAVLRGVELEGRARSVDACTVIERRRPLFFARVRSRLAGAIDQGGSAELAPLLRGLALRDFRGTSVRPDATLGEAGFGHLYVLDGVTLELVFGAILLLVRSLLRRSSDVTLGLGARRLTAIVMLPLLAVAVGSLGATPSVLRVGVVLLAILLPMLLDRAPDPWSALGLGLTAVLFLDPAAFGDVSFQLAFVSLSAYFRVEQLLRRPTEPKPEPHPYPHPHPRSEPEPQSGRPALRPARWVFASAAYAGGAAIAALPLVARRFDHVTLASLLAGGIAAPTVAGFVAPLAWIGAGLGAFSSALARPLLWLSGAGLSFVLALADGVSSLGRAAVPIPTPTIAECVLFYLATVFVSARHTRARSIGLFLAILSFGSVIVRAVSH